MKPNPTRLLLSLAAASALCFQSALQAADYTSAVLSDAPLVYFRLNDTNSADIAVNSGSQGATGNGTHSPGVGHRSAGAIVGSGSAATEYFGNGTRTTVPYTPAMNPSSSSPFTIEAWLKPTAITDNSVGPSPLFNRISTGNRSGWVFFQRAPNTGWNFAMYSGSGSTVGVGITGGTYAQNEWGHVAATWDGTSARLYVNGQLVAGPTSGIYNASTAATLSIGSYDTGSNPFTGAADEVAFYPTALSASQLLAHYENGTNSARSTPYESLVLADGAVQYLRLDETHPAISTAVNQGSLGATGDGKHFPGMAHQVPGAIIGSSETAAGYSAIDKSSTDGGQPTIVPFKPELNTAVFSVESWLKPTIDGAGNAQCPIYNRREDSPRTGWVFFQRDAATGWNFRMYNGVNTDRSIDITGGSYVVGNWYHVVSTFDGTTGRLFVNGQQVASQAVVGSYAPNADTIRFAVGGYPDGTSNPFTGSIDEVALYNTVLSPSDVLAHYQNGTNAARSTPYETLVQTSRPVEYLRLNEPARNRAANLGSLGSAANATLVNTTNVTAGPRANAFVGFDSTNVAAAFNGVNSYIELGHPTALNFAGQITMEAWVQPASTQAGQYANILAHGANDTQNAEVSLRINDGNTYFVGSWDGVANRGASFAIPGGDLGSGTWVHLAGTYDGTNWNLFRNGKLVATAADTVGALAVNNANWAIGARGRWKNGAGYPDAGQERVFSGAIDEAAIYNKALTPSQIQGHYSMGYFGPKPLAVTSATGNVTLTWPAGAILQIADNVEGPYTDVDGATSPYQVQSNQSRKFFRFRQ